MSVRIIVNIVLDACGVAAPVEWISPVVATELDGCAARSPEWISPAQAVTENTHASAIASAKRLILSVSPLRLRNASLLARKQHSVNTYKAIDTASRAGD
jgi:hypothetical protein